MFNLFSLKDLLKLVISFKKYDLVIDVEEYFRTSTLMALWLGKVSIGYSNLKIRKL
jgi:ADP-heptose:LPS heptosyltransferase